MWKPCGDTLIVERYKRESPIIRPDDLQQQEGETYIVKDVGVGYVTEQGVIIPPEVKIGDKVLIQGKVLSLMTDEGQILLARAQDVVCYEREG